MAVGLEDNVRQAHEFLFPEETYEPTETVKNISNELMYLTQIYPAGYWEESSSENTDTESDGESDYE